METAAHHSLKSLAIAFLRQQGCRAVATEVSCPFSRYRFDVAGYLETRGQWEPCRAGEREPPPVGAFGVSRGSNEPRTIVIECKQSREDFLRDAARVESLLAQRAEYECILRSIEEHRIKAMEPQLRRSGTSLFAELEDWDFAASRLPGYQKVLRHIRRLDVKLYGETKFFLMSKYQLADCLFIAAPRGMIRPRELPRGWGLLECPAQLLREHECAMELDRTVFELAVQAPVHQSKLANRFRLLRNIAIAASRGVRG